MGNWDADRLGQVASNLISNALQYGDASEPIQIRLDGTREEAITFSVENVGVIPPDVQQPLFDPFRGGQRQRGRKEGLGLGLYIVQQIVQAHQGDVEVESGSSRYTEFPRRGLDVVKL